MTSKQFLKSLSNIEKQLANINKAMGASKTKSTTKTKDNGIKKLIKSIEKCDKKSKLKKFTVAQLTGFLEHKGIKIRKSVKNDLIDAVTNQTPVIPETPIPVTQNRIQVTRIQANLSTSEASPEYE